MGSGVKHCYFLRINAMEKTTDYYLCSTYRIIVKQDRPGKNPDVIFWLGRTLKYPKEQLTLL